MKSQGLKLSVVVFLIVAAQLSAQSPKPSGQAKANPNASTKSDVTPPKNSFVLSQDGSRYHLEQPITPDNANSKTAVHIEGQVGTLNDKPAFGTIIIDPKQAPTTAAEADDLLHKYGSMQTPGSQQAALQACRGTLVCVETRKDSGSDVCIKWECR
jgi:hypothetical protein